MDWLKGIALLSVSALCITLSFAVRTIEKHASATLMDVDATIQKVNGKNGTLQQLDQVLTDTRVIVAHSDRLLTQQQASLVKFDGQLSATIAALNETLISVKQTSDITAQSEQNLAQASVDAMKGVEPVLSSANNELAQLALATEHLDALVSDPNLTATIANVNGATKHLDDTSAGVQEYVHGILHPTWPQRVWGVIMDIGSALNPFHL